MAPPVPHLYAEQHPTLRLVMVAPNGAEIPETERFIPAYLNADASAPLKLRVEVMHDCGCSKRIALWDVPPYC